MRRVLDLKEQAQIDVFMYFKELFFAYIVIRMKSSQNLQSLALGHVTVEDLSNMNKHNFFFVAQVTVLH